MNQEKIGKFIAKLRKQKKLTQEQLAEKLGITKNAVSKWERGLGLMDLSLLKPLSHILEVSVTEILNGERFTKEEIDSKSEETLIDTLDYSADSDSYVDKGILIDTYYCVSDDVITVIPTFKNTNYNCPSE